VWSGSLPFLITLFRVEAMMKTQMLGRAIVFAVFVIHTTAHPAPGQNSEQDKIALRTRLVLLDVLVTEKRNGTAVDDLVSENFEVLADQTLRPVTHFSTKREEATARPAPGA
jgi:hypothetical protein